MKEYEELFANYSKLGVDEKRDAFNEELVKVAYIIKNYLNKYNQDIVEEPYNYKKETDKVLTESELLDLNFKNIYYIKSELLILMSLMDSRGANNGS